MTVPVPPIVDAEEVLTPYRLSQAVKAASVNIEIPQPEEPQEQEDCAEEKTAEIEDLSLTGASLTSNSANKPWMDWRAVTDTASLQYQILSVAYHRDDGLLEVDGCICVALGSYWGPVGTRYRAVIGGREVYLIKADAKQDAHTYGGMGIEGMNGHLIEAVVDTDRLVEMALIMGDCDYVPALNGTITELEVIG